MQEREKNIVLVFGQHIWANPAAEMNGINISAFEKLTCVIWDLILVLWKDDEMRFYEMGLQSVATWRNKQQLLYIQSDLSICVASRMRWEIWGPHSGCYEVLWFWNNIVQIDEIQTTSRRNLSVGFQRDIVIMSLKIKLVN
jgi:hypothetical protein